MSHKWIWIVLAWFCCSFVARGLALGYFSREYPRSEHTSFATAFGIAGGPFALLTALLVGRPYAWRLTQKRNPVGEFRR